VVGRHAALRGKQRQPETNQRASRSTLLNHIGALLGQLYARGVQVLPNIDPQRAEGAVEFSLIIEVEDVDLLQPRISDLVVQWIAKQDVSSGVLSRGNEQTVPIGSRKSE